MIEKQELIDSVQRWAPGKYDSALLDRQSVEQLKNILASAVEDFQRTQAERLLDIEIEREDNRAAHKQSQWESEYQQRQAEARANEAENKRVFPIAARQFGFAEVQANFTVLVDALGTLTVYGIQQFLATNPTVLAQATPEVLEQRNKEAAAAHQQYLNGLPPGHPDRQADIEQRRAQAQQAEADRRLKAMRVRDESLGFPVLPEINLETGERLDSAYFMRLTNTDMGRFRSYMRLYGSSQVTEALRNRK
jgi:hypothetical protein